MQYRFGHFGIIILQLCALPTACGGASFTGGVIVRPDARKLVDCWAKWYYHDQPLDTIEPLGWLWDQITLAEAWTEANVPCAVIPMDVYGNEELGTGSAIWHANVPEKARYYQLFLNEYQRQSMELSQSK